MAVENYGQDGTVHLTYFDKGTQLSFVWDAEHNNTIAVSHGGYAEPVIDVIEASFVVEASLSLILIWFQTDCQDYIDKYHQENQ